MTAMFKGRKADALQNTTVYWSEASVTDKFQKALHHYTCIYVQAESFATHKICKH